MKRIALLLLVPALAAAATALPAQIPDKFTNLEVLPDDIPRDSLVQIMRSFAMSLGVRCGYCHVPKEGTEREELDFASDDKVEKRQARFMMRLVRDLNTEELSGLPERSDPPVRVTCVTCHRRSPVPRTIDVVIAETIDSAGVAAAVEHYRRLREETMESGRYDFSEWPVNELARKLAAGGKRAEAIALLEMNGQLHPASADIDVQLADIYRAAGDREKAIVYYRTALEKQPSNQNARRRLDELTGAAPAPQPPRP